MDKEIELQGKKSSKLRVATYLLLVVCFALAIALKVRSISRSEKSKIVSLFSEWDVNGVPVNAMTVKKSDFEIYERITGQLTSPTSLKSFATLTLKEKLAKGQKIVAYWGEKSVDGAIEEVSPERNISYGLFPVLFSLKTPINNDGGAKVHVKINTTTFKNVLSIPIEAIMTNRDGSYVYKIEGSRAIKTKIETGHSDGFKTEITKGLKEKDLIISEGVNDVKDGEKIRVYSCTGCI